MSSITLYTIGFTRKSAEEFFGLLEGAGVQRVLDIRLNNVSQLAGFTKQPDLAFFLKRILGIGCLHMPELAPTPEILEAYRARRINWATYEKQFQSLIEERHIENLVTPQLAENACLLCSEPKADRCHRRLVAEYLQSRWAGVRVVHL
jgi:uncharacterized protein (DUF488 family)